MQHTSFDLEGAVEKFRALLTEQQARAEKIRNEISQLQIAYGDGILATTLSMGVAVMPAHAGDAKGLLYAAGESMQMAIQSGANRVIIADALANNH